MLPFAGAAGVMISGRWPNLREAVTLITAASVCLVVLRIYSRFLDGALLAVDIAEPMPGLTIRFEVEPLGMLFALVASILWLITSIYAIGYMRAHHEQNQTRFYALFAIAIGSTLGAAFAGNLLSLFLFYELLTVITYPLVAHEGTDEARRGARTYIGILLTTSIALQLLAADIMVTTDRNPVYLNQSFRLTFEAIGAIDGDPDFSPLEEQLDIISRSHSNSINYINGGYSRRMNWTFTAMARRAGELTLPTIAFGKDQSPSYRLTVKPAAIWVMTVGITARADWRGPKVLNGRTTATGVSNERWKDSAI